MRRARGLADLRARAEAGVDLLGPHELLEGRLVPGEPFGLPWDGAVMLQTEPGEVGELAVGDLRA